MKIGRNDPCPCGSGKKYKKCCLAKDAAAGREHMASLADKQQSYQARLQRPDAQEVEESAGEIFELAQPPLFPSQPPLSLIPASPATPEAMLDELMRPDVPLWDEFEATAPEYMLDFFKATLNDEELDSDLTFEMIATIRDKNSRAVFDQALEALHQQRPELYEHDQHHYLDWQISDALISGNLAILPELCDGLMSSAGHSLDSFNDSLKRLCYYGQTSRVADMMLQAIPEIGKHQELFDWVAEEHAVKTIDMLLYKHYEHNPNLQPDDAALQADLSQIQDISLEQLPHILDLLTARIQPTWSLADFEFRRSNKKHQEEDPAVQKLYELLLVFMGITWRKQHIPLAKGELARNALYHYILGRHAGDIAPVDEDDDEIFGFGLSSRRKQPKKKVKYQPINVLCPDRATEDRMIASMISIFSSDFYSAAAFMELTPAWVAFLVEQNLLESNQAAMALEEIYELVELMGPVWERSTGDPHIRANIEQAWGQ